MLPIIILSVLFVIILALMGYGTWLCRRDIEELRGNETHRIAAAKDALASLEPYEGSDWGIPDE